MGTELTRQSLFREMAKSLRREFDELVAGVPHDALRGGEAERIVGALLRRHIPRRFEVGSGFVLDARDRLSRQTDVLVYDALNCPVYRSSENAGIYPSDNVAAAIEVKSTLDAEQLRDAFEKNATMKSLSKSGPARLDSPARRQTLTCVFAFGSRISMDAIAKHYHEDCCKRLIQHTDMVVVLEKGIVMLSARHGQNGWNPAVVEDMPPIDGAHLAVGVSEFGQDTLDAFLRMLLPQLSSFRAHVPSAGFNWANTESRNRVTLTYLTSTCTEVDPMKRAEKLRLYADEVRREFAASDPRRSSSSDKPTG